jgi:hypothetical protein
MLLGLLVAVATNLPELFYLILHFRESNVSVSLITHFTNTD